MATLRKVARMAFWAESKDTNSGEAVDLAREAAWSRRRFLEATGKGLLLTGAAPVGGLIKPTLLGSLNRALAPRIARRWGYGRTQRLAHLEKGGYRRDGL